MAISERSKTIRRSRRNCRRDICIYRIVLPVEEASKGIKTGKRCEKLDWIQLNVIPENGNY